jgi:general secretion pathway protein N
MRVLLVVFAAVVLLALAVVALAPASLVVTAVENATSSRIALAEVDGTVWNGSGTLVDGEGRRLPLAWKTDGVAAARGKLHLRVMPRANEAGPRADITLDDGKMHARDVALVVPATWLAESFARALPIAVTGDVAVTIASLDWASQGSAGDARFEWRDARLSAAGAAPLDLGKVTATLAARDNQLAGPIANEGGDLAVAGNVAAFANGAGEADVLLTPRRSDETTTRMLAAIGTPEGGGYRVRAQWHAR